MPRPRLLQDHEARRLQLVLHGALDGLVLQRLEGLGLRKDPPQVLLRGELPEVDCRDVLHPQQEELDRHEIDDNFI